MPTAFCATCQRVVHLGEEHGGFCPVCASPLVGPGPGEYRPDRAADRIARNEVLFREANERIRDASAVGGAEEVAFVCECGQASCDAPISLTVAEYERVRSNPAWFVTVPGHDFPGVEKVVEHGERHQLVEKLGPPRELVRRLDPRSS